MTPGQSSIYDEVMVLPDTLRCSGCRQHKPDDEFSVCKANHTRRQRQWWCKECRRSTYEKSVGGYTKWKNIPSDTTLICTVCGEEKPDEEFNRHAAAAPARRGRLTRCRACDAPMRRRMRRNHQLKRYGMTIEEYEALLAQQGGTCAVCDSDNNGRTMHVDHCHANGHVRGLLCSPCNTALGLSADDPERLRSLANYLERTAQ